jgi:hypothetical protein
MGGVVTIPSILRSKLLKTWLRLSRAGCFVVNSSSYGPQTPRFTVAAAPLRE